MEIHPAANTFPMMDKDEYAALVENIRLHGLRVPILLCDDMILDGRNRYAACLELGIEPKYQTWQSDGDPFEYVWSLNAERRNLSAMQKALLRIEFERQRSDWFDIQERRKAEADQARSEAAKAQPREGGGFGAGAVSIDTAPARDNRERYDIAAKAQVSTATAARAQALYNADPELAKKVMAGDISYSEAKRTPHVANNSGENEWYTPLEYIEAARKVMGEIELDPASSDVANKTVRATEYFTKEDDGLSEKWFGKVWMNPPYSGDLIGKFIQKLIYHILEGFVPEAIVLVNNATETGWFQLMLEHASAVCFIRGRIKYLDATGHPANSPLQGQAILYFGDEPERFCHIFRDFGKVLYDRK